MNTAHKNKVKSTKILSLVRKYLRTSTNDYRKIEKIRNSLKKYMNIYKLCNSCSKVIELRDYYKEHFNSVSLEKFINKWNREDSWISCQICEKEKDILKNT